MIHGRIHLLESGLIDLLEASKDLVAEHRLQIGPCASIIDVLC